MIDILKLYIVADAPLGQLTPTLTVSRNPRPIHSPANPNANPNFFCINNAPFAAGDKHTTGDFHV